MRPFIAQFSNGTDKLRLTSIEIGQNNFGDSTYSGTFSFPLIVPTDPVQQFYSNLEGTKT
jgi:hypothetical protein